MHVRQPIFNRDYDWKPGWLGCHHCDFEVEYDGSIPPAWVIRGFKEHDCGCTH